MLPVFTPTCPSGDAPAKGDAVAAVKSSGNPGPVTESPNAIPAVSPETL